jgi:hypothetical protein
MSSFAKNFLSTTITNFYTEVENFLKTKNFDNLPPLSEFLNYIEFEAEAKIEEKKSKRSTRVANSNNSSDPEEKCSFVGSRGGKCKSVAKKDCNGLCKKHFDQAGDSKNNTDSERSAGAGESDEKKSKSKSKSKTTVKTGKGLSSVVSKALEDSDQEDEPEVKVQSRRTKPIDSDSKESNKESDNEENGDDEKKAPAKKAPAKKAKKSDDKDSKKSEEKKSSRDSKTKTSKKKDDEETKETKPSYAPITFNRDSTSFVYDENADDGFVYKTGDFNTVYAVRHRGVAVKPTRVHIEEIKKAGKSVGVVEDEDDSR